MEFIFKPPNHAHQERLWEEDFDSFSLDYWNQIKIRIPHEDGKVEAAKKNSVTENNPYDPNFSSRMVPIYFTEYEVSTIPIGMII
jgi:hypothetical protein